MTRTCLDLFSGLGGFSAAFEDADGWDVVTVDIEDRFDPDIKADVLDLRPSDLPDADVVLASPPCTAFSIASGRTHLDENGRPASEWGAESLALVHHTIGLIKGLDPDWWILENPNARMQWELGRPDAQVWLCQYGADVAKPTDLWGDIPPSFDVRKCFNENPDCDHERAPDHANAGTQRSDRTAAERAKLPYGLSAEIYRAVENPAPVQTTLAEVSP